MGFCMGLCAADWLECGKLGVGQGRQRDGKIGSFGGDAS